MHLLIVFTFCFIGFGSSAILKDTDPVKVTLYSESYCPDCIIYTSSQLYPAFKYFSSNINIDLVPFGFAKQMHVDGHWVFRCQHGEKECYGNRLQVCAIQQACGDGGSVHCRTNRLGQLLKYITCVEAEPDQGAASDECAKKAHLDPTQITDCAKGDEGEHLLNMYGNRTEAVSPPLGYVPFVLINDVHNQEAEEDLHKEICKIRPDLCKQQML